MAVVRQWFGARRLALKARYAGERLRVRAGTLLSREPAMLALDDIHRRLELVLTAAYGRPIAIAAKAEHGWMRRRLYGLAPFLYKEEPPTVRAGTIELPPRLPTRGDARRATDRYRLFAIEQAERVTRGTLSLAAIADPLERDLYLLREAAAIDADIARSYPGMRAAMDDERTRVLAHRPKQARLTTPERDVERLVVNTLKTPAVELEPASEGPAASLEWARRTAEEIRRRGGRYRGVPLAPAWGSVPPVSSKQPPGYNPTQTLLPGPKPSSGSSQAADEDEGQGSEAPDRNASDEDTRADVDGRTANEGEPSQKRDATPAIKAADSSAGAPVPSDASGNPQSTLDVTGGLRGTTDEPADDLPPAIHYDEWDGDRCAYARAAVSVRLYPAKTGNAAWLRTELQSHAAIARQIRHQFERLRARRTLSLRQMRGDGLDLAACVEAMIARRMGDAPNDRLYVDARPARRGIAISLLVDASGSTDTRVTESWRIIDLEKIALMLATQALDALGDLYAIYAFSGRQRTNVKITVVKDFSEPNGDLVARRIAAINPDGFTRLGATVRHATRELARQTAGHRLLLLLSDGRPNDIDAYQGPYGVEDSRQAILEARASGVFPYCLTIDKAASEYLPRIFGRAGHTVLQKPEQLPKALLGVVRSLIKQ